MGLLEAVREEIEIRELERADHAEEIEERSARINVLNGELEKLAGVARLAGELLGEGPAEDDEPAVVDPPEHQPPARSSAASTPSRETPAAAPATKTKESAAAAAKIVEETLGRHGELTQAQLATFTGMKAGRVQAALEKVAVRTGENRKGDRGGRASPVWRLKSAEESGPRILTREQAAAAARAQDGGGEASTLSRRTERSLARAEQQQTPANGSAPADEALRARILEVLEEHGARLGDDLYDLVEQPDNKLMAQCMRTLIESGKVRKVGRAGHVYYEAIGTT